MSTVPAQQDNCPGILRLHEAADGSLARVRLPGGRVDSRGLRGVADTAELGNGLIELTSRASLQVRGLPAASGARCAALLSGAGLLPFPSHERVRNILASPVGGRHPHSLAATDDVVVELDRAVCTAADLAGLAGRFLFGVDDGAHLLGERVPDVALVAHPAGGFSLHVHGAPTGEPAAPDAAIRLAVDAARKLLRAAGRGPALAAATSTSRAGATLELGRLEQTDGRCALTLMPRLGRLDPPLVRQLATVAECSRTDVRLSTARTITLPDLERGAVEPVRQELLALGLIDDPASGWHGLSACSGIGACARALHDVRSEAERRAAERHRADPREHWAACPRGCGRPAGAHVAYTATAEGIRREEVVG